MAWTNHYSALFGAPLVPMVTFAFNLFKLCSIHLLRLVYVLYYICISSLLSSAGLRKFCPYVAAVYSLAGSDGSGSEGFSRIGIVFKDILLAISEYASIMSPEITVAFAKIFRILSVRK